MSMDENASTRASQSRQVTPDPSDLERGAARLENIGNDNMSLQPEPDQPTTDPPGLETKPSRPADNDSTNTPWKVKVVDFFLDGEIHTHEVASSQYDVLELSKGVPNCVRLLVCRVIKEKESFDRKVHKYGLLPDNGVHQKDRWHVSDIYTFERFLEGIVGCKAALLGLTEAHTIKDTLYLVSFEIHKIPDNHNNGFVLSFRLPDPPKSNDKNPFSRAYPENETDEIDDETDKIAIRINECLEPPFTKNSDIAFLFRLTVLRCTVFLVEKSMMALRKLATTRFESQHIIDPIPNWNPIMHGLDGKVGAILSSLDILTTEGKPKGSPYPELNALGYEIQAMVKFCKEGANMVLEARERLSNLQVARMNLRESRSVMRLTIMATIFLPLSLATGLLSMQSRVVELHLLLYDWVGLVLNMGAVVYLGFAILNSERWKQTIKGLDNILGILIIQFLPYATILVFLVAFNTGMFHSTAASLKVMKYGFAAVGAILVIGQLLVFAFLFLLRGIGIRVGWQNGRLRVAQPHWVPRPYWVRQLPRLRYRWIAKILFVKRKF